MFNNKKGYNDNCIGPIVLSFLFVTQFLLQIVFFTTYINSNEKITIDTTGENEYNQLLTEKNQLQVKYNDLKNTIKDLKPSNIFWQMFSSFLSGIGITLIIIFLPKFYKKIDENGNTKKNNKK